MSARLLQLCCWDNPQFSHAVLYELLWQVWTHTSPTSPVSPPTPGLSPPLPFPSPQIAFAYTYELRPYLDLLLHMLCMEDSWQNRRIQKALKDIPDDHR